MTEFSETTMYLKDFWVSRRNILPFEKKIMSDSHGPFAVVIRKMSYNWPRALKNIHNTKSILLIML